MTKYFRGSFGSSSEERLQSWIKILGILVSRLSLLPFLLWFVALMPVKKKPRTSRAWEFTSHLVRLLITQWCWEARSAAQVQVEAAAAFEDQRKLLQGIGVSEDFIDSELKLLAGLGSSGRHKNHCKVELERALGAPDYPATTSVPVRMKVAKP